jgi:cadmium resistance transport/sequestration family protein
MELILTSILAFASTNIDDIFILTLLLGDKRFKTTDVYFGQYLGIITLVALSIAGALFGNFVDGKYIGLMGLFPIYLGIRQLLTLRKKNEEGDTEKLETKLSTGILSVAGITIANGGDNIGTYIPIFTTLSSSELVMMIAIFLVMVFIWLSLASYLTHHPLLAKTISNHGDIVTPIVLCLLGLFILQENGSFELLR